MGIKLNPNKLISRVIRFNASQGVRGNALLSGGGVSTILTPSPRRLTNLTRLSSQGGQGGIAQFLWNTASSFVGFLGSALGFIAFSATAIWGWLIGRIEQVKSFNWNASDQQIQSMIQSQNVQIASLWGGVIGQGIGYLAGIGVGYGIGFICPVIGGSVLARGIASKVLEETIEDVMPSLRNAIAATAGVVGNALLLNGYMQFRRFLRAAPKRLLSALFGEREADFIKDRWGGEGQPDISFNHQMDELVDSISNGVVQAFIEELFDESWDSFMEAGFIIAQEIDDAYQQSRVANKGVLGVERTVTIEPEGDDSDEKLIFQDVPENLLIPSIQSAVNEHRLLWGKDIGSIVAQPYEDYVRAKVQLRKLTIEFNGRPRPPWRLADGKESKRVICSIPDVKRGLTWNEIKNAASSFSWGKYRATAQLNNQRQMVVYGSSGLEAEQKLRQLLALSTAEILRLSVSEEEVVPEGMRKHTTTVYPAYFTLIAKTSSLDGEGRTTIDNRVFTERLYRIPLWTQSEPPNIPPIL